MKEINSVAFFAFNGFEELDLFGPWEVFMLVNRMGLELECVITAREKMVTAAGGAQILPNLRVDEVDETSLLVVPGGRAARPRPRPGNVEDVRSLAARSQQLASVCTGTFLLAEAGLLTGLRVTTNAAWITPLAERYPDLGVIDATWHHDRHVWSGGAIASGIPLALAIVETTWGSDLAQDVASRLNFPKRK